MSGVFPIHSAPRLSVICDYPEEGWTSMDLVAEMLLRELRRSHAERLQAIEICPPFFRLATRIPAIRSRKASLNIDRILNRWSCYPRALRRLAKECEWHHVCDHSYAHLIHELPPERSGVYCHDLDAFRCLLAPRQEPRPRWFRALARRTLNGMAKAAVVFCNSKETREQLGALGLIDPAKVVLAPLGPAAEFTPLKQQSDCAAIDKLTSIVDEPYLLHVGSCVPRKRVEVAIEAFALARKRGFRGKLVQVGGRWTEAQSKQIAQLGVGSAIRQIRGISRDDLAALYRGASLVLLPSEAEGFGLPLIEALACGAAILASDIPVLREVGGAAATYAPVGEATVWAETASKLLDDPQRAPSQKARQLQGAKFSWSHHAQVIVAAYQQLAGVGMTESRSTLAPERIAG